MSLALSSWIGRMKGGYRPTVPDLILVKLLFSKSQLVQIPWALTFFQPSVRNLERALKKRKLKTTTTPTTTTFTELSIIRPSTPNHEIQVECDLQLFPILLSRPPLLIVPETTDGNCECKHVNIAGVMAKSTWSRGPLHHQRETITARNGAKPFLKTTTLCQKW